MSDNSKIEWTEASWNPVTGCDEVSPGCDNCYAKTFAERWRGIPGHHFEQGFDVVLRPERLDQPLRWKRPRRIFVNSMSDLFHEEVPDWFIAEVFGVMARAPQHTFQLLTKRHGRMRSLLGGDGVRLLDAAVNEMTAQALYDQWPVPNVWLGVSVEDQKRADLRIPALLATPAAVRWLSCEPLLGPVDIWLAVRGTRYSCHACEFGGRDDCNIHRVDRLDWVVVGGESGRGARPMHPAWARQLRDQCTTAGVPYFFKQWGEWGPERPIGPTERGRFQYLGPNGERFDERNPPDMDPTWANLYRFGKKAAGRELDGRTWDEYPHIAEAAAR